MGLPKDDFNELTLIVTTTADQELLKKIITSSDSFSGRQKVKLLCTMATNPNLSLEVQTILVSLPIDRLKCYLIQCKNLDETILRKLATCKIRNTAELAIRHENASEIVNRYYLMGKYKKNG